MLMARHLLLRLQAPLMAFGGETIDNLGVIRDFPALSMITGLLANALGWRREHSEHHARLQERLVIGMRIERFGNFLQEYQNVQLQKNDCGWTTSGKPEERAGDSYNGPHRRLRDYHADRMVLVALRLDPSEDAPTIDELAQALHQPARPLFFGRKPCLPSAPVYAGWQDGEHLLSVLQQAPRYEGSEVTYAMQWPVAEGCLAGDRIIDVCDERNWVSGVHGGWRSVRVGSITLRES
jgi:CRISPR system Cascade subunit CasD